MSAELDARRIAAAAVLGDFAAWARGETVPGAWQVWALRLATEVRSLLEHLDTDQDAGQLAQIRLVLDSFDWERDDRQFALEQIEDVLREQP